MKNICFLIGFFMFVFMTCSFVYAQDRLCHATPTNLVGKYTGDCKRGLPNGKGEAQGIDRYTGWFKNGVPHGNGTYYYSDTAYFKGNFQEGLKEGIGEIHYLHKGQSDSVVKGYWSGDIYQGKKYTTYKLSTTTFFDRIEVIPSDNPGNTVTIETATSSGSPNGVPTHANGAGFNSGYVLTLSELRSPTASILKAGSKYESSYKSSITYELTGFPCQLFGMFSNGETFTLDLYRAANWKVRFFVNK